jgi:two-component system, NarL family, nitrate/nitrite response regulator NarL
VSSLRCLIVDDNEEFLASAAQLFSLQGVTVAGLASSGDEAVKLAAELGPDIVLVDVELGEEDGIEVARRLTSADSPGHVILISLRDHEQLTELIADSGAVGFLRKDALDVRAVTDLITRHERRGPPAADSARRLNQLAREELRALAEQQGALRRVATLVAQGTGPERLFDVIAEEASRLLGVAAINLGEYHRTPGRSPRSRSPTGGAPYGPPAAGGRSISRHSAA